VAWWDRSTEAPPLPTRARVLTEPMYDPAGLVLRS